MILYDFLNFFKQGEFSSKVNLVGNLYGIILFLYILIGREGIG